MSAMLEDAAATLLDLQQPVGKRTRSIFHLLGGGTQKELDVLCQALSNRADSELMRHELAYVIGQFQNPSACNLLARVVADEDDDAMVRHEAAEALGAIGDLSALPVLQTFAKHPAPEIAETCELAVERIEYVTKRKQEQEGELDENPYCSVDPAPAAEASVSTAELRRILLDSKAPLFDRYRAMFSLRNRNTPESVQALIDSFAEPSALFCHEVAYIMGQLVHPDTVPALREQLADLSKHRMVRHEAAEALGAIATKECEEALRAFLDDPVQVVRESCQVGLDIMVEAREEEEAQQAKEASFLHVHDKLVRDE